MTLRLTSISVSLTLTFVMLAAIAAFAASSDPNLSETAIVLQKDAEVLSSRARTYLQQRSPETATVWVFFTDKGIGSRSTFAQAATGVILTDRAARRRAKVGLDKPVFADLPVVTGYVHDVETQGATLRRTSKWLNAASFDIPMDKLDAVAALPYVHRITPVAKYKKTYDVVEETRGESPTTSQSPDVLNYGPSAQQLQQITVPAAHGKGYTGQGVTLAIFDTGFRKTHEAFANAYLEGRVLAEHDFIFNDGNTANEAGDASNQWDHGTYTWSTSAGLKDGALYGPAYKANFILCKTEDVRSETSVEEDNWVAALEWVDSIGCDVITSSLGYSDWYTYADMDGNTAITTLAANTAAGLGIVHCNSMGNSGPAAGTLSAPADAFNMIAVGAVASTGTIASFSSRGPTYDGRTKPEVCARGVSTYCASSGSNSSYASVNGTSLSTPLVAGVACLLIQAHPTFTPGMIRQALMETASQAATPNNTYGWGIINTDAAISWGVNFTASTTVGPVPLNVQFTNSSTIPATSHWWHFGDGDSSSAANPLHAYTVPGFYSVKLVSQTTYGELSTEKINFVVAHADTLRYGVDSAFAGHQITKSILLTNSLPLQSITIPMKIDSMPLDLVFDSITFGARTSYFEEFTFLNYDADNGRFVIRLTANTGSGAPDLPPGSGEVLKVFMSIDPYAIGGIGNTIDTAISSGKTLEVTTAQATYSPVYTPGVFASKNIMRSDLNRDFFINLTDLSTLISYLTLFTPVPITVQAGDFNADKFVDLSDLSGLIAYLVDHGAPPANP